MKTLEALEQLVASRSKDAVYLADKIRHRRAKDGLQGSENWITGSNRLEKAVGVDQSRDLFIGEGKAISASKVLQPQKNLSGATK
jgi:hypothetical protein